MRQINEQMRTYYAEAIGQHAAQILL
jgi:hypothetical protein